MNEGAIPKYSGAVDFWDEQKTLFGRAKSIVRSWFRGQKIFDVGLTLVV